MALLLKDMIVLMRRLLLSVIFLAPYSVADCICCDYPSLVSAVSSISASVSALLLPALCLICVLRVS